MVYLAGVQLLSGIVWAAYELAMMLMFFEAIPRQDRTSVLTFYNWGNAIGDPSTSTGFAFIGPFAVWRSQDMEQRVGPLFVEKDEAKRIAGYKAVDHYIAEQGYVIPLYQYYQPVVHRKGMTFTPHGAGTIAPQTIRPK